MQLTSIEIANSPVVPASPPARDVKLECQILVIDDDRSVQQAFLWALQDLDCQVVAAPNLADALAQMSAVHFIPDAVVADFHLDGGASGLEVIRLLRRLFHTELLACIITGDGSISELGELDAENIRCLSKPVGYADLDNLIADFRIGIARKPTILDFEI